ncbi:MAG TPA: DUF4139 domain-containing protein [Chitinophagaceae bacterium]
MKKVVFLLFTMIGAVNSLFAGDEKNIVSATLQSVTVYRVGAELVHKAKATLPQGNNELIIDGISNSVDINSIQVGCDDKITILSVAFSTDYLKPVVKSVLVKRLEDSTETLGKELSKVHVVLTTDGELLDLLKSNKKIGGSENGLNVAELMKMMEYYKNKVLDLQNELSLYKDKENRLKQIIDKINRQIREEEQKNTSTTGKLVLQLLNPQAGEYGFTISYITRNAYWTPYYDLRVESISKPIRLMYKAKVVQTTGIDWKQVKLTLATSTPNQNGNAPVLTSWFLGYVDPVVRMEGALSKTNSIQAMTGRVPGLEVTQGYATLKKENDKVDLGDYVKVNENQMDVTFNIDIPYDLPGNGKEQSVALKEYPVNAGFKYYCVPKLDRDAYLLGEVADWESLNLLPGEANIIFEGTYIGKSYIDPNSTMDTMNLTLGKDKRIVVKKEKLKDYSSVKFLGSNTKQVMTYEITVKNNKKEPIQMLLKDQYPLSTNKEIEVELLESSDAANNTDLGVLTWKLQLAPGEQKKFRVSYSVKYPKDKYVNLGM